MCCVTLKFCELLKVSHVKGEREEISFSWRVRTSEFAGEHKTRKYCVN